MTFASHLSTRDEAEVENLETSGVVASPYANSAMWHLSIEEQALDHVPV